MNQTTKLQIPGLMSPPVGAPNLELGALVPTPKSPSGITLSSRAIERLNCMPEAIKPSPDDPNFARNLAKWIQIQNTRKDIEKQAAITKEEMYPTKKGATQKPGFTKQAFGQ